MQDVFDPPGVAWHPVSLRLIRARRITAAAWTAPLPVAGAVVALTTGQWWPWIPAGAFALLLVWEMWIIGRQVRAVGWAERDEDLLIRRGVMFRSMVVIPYGRMQYVDVKVGPLDRACRIAGLQLHTAAAATDASLPGLDPQEAARLRDRLASRGEARLAGL